MNETAGDLLGNNLGTLPEATQTVYNGEDKVNEGGLGVTILHDLATMEVVLK